MLNKCDFIGRLGKDPEVRYTPSGTAVANFSIAATEKWTDKNGDKQERTEWIRIVAFARLAEIMGEYLSKGSLVYISGRLQTRSWEDKEGIRRYTTEIVAKEMLMLDTKKRSEGNVSPPMPDDDIPFS